MKVIERVLEMKIMCQLMACSLASCLAREPLMLFSSCDRFRRDTKRRRRSCTMISGLPSELLYANELVLMAPTME